MTCFANYRLPLNLAPNTRSWVFSGLKRGENLFFPSLTHCPGLLGPVNAMAPRPCQGGEGDNDAKVSSFPGSAELSAVNGVVSIRCVDLEPVLTGNEALRFSEFLYM